MNNDELLEQLNNTPETTDFDTIIQYISDNYVYTPARFYNGLNEDKITNEAGSNEGSCKIFSLAKLLNLNESQTLNCFGKYYREDVLKNLQGSDHANIRAFMKYGWDGIEFDGQALTPK
ncbi:MAG: HopJ type III effector protein [Gammaproteobacteria bacterium]|nr:HopJ type III effector protein [Gammaproteobacteria bacterium]